MKKLSQGIASWLCRCKELSEFSAEIQYAVHQILWDLSTFILSLICLQLIYSDIQSGLLFSTANTPLACSNILRMIRMPSTSSSVWSNMMR